MTCLRVCMYEREGKEGRETGLGWVVDKYTGAAGCLEHGLHSPSIDFPVSPPLNSPTQIYIYIYICMYIYIYYKMYKIYTHIYDRYV